jgi:hypothetical protein
MDTPSGALELIVQSGQYELIMHPRLIDLVDKKWERFSRRIFFRRFLITLTYLLIFLLTTILDSTRTETVRALCQKDIPRLNVLFDFCFDCRQKVKVMK